MTCLVIIAVVMYMIAGPYAMLAGPPNDVCDKYKKGDRYFYFPGDDGKVYLVDTKEKDCESPISFRVGKSDKYTYKLYTKANPKDGEILKMNDVESIEKSKFDAKKVTVFLVHGWKGNENTAMNKKLRKAFLNKEDVNVISFDWGVIAKRCYLSAVNRVPEVGSELGKFINWLVTLGLSYQKVHLIGFSLGGHVVGNAGKETGSKVRRITALDPAGPWWSGNPNRIVKSNGVYVEVIHTNTRLYGFSDPCGHADFYPNGGSFMPGCWLNVCSHYRAFEYMEHSVKFDNMMSNECNSLKDAHKDRCTGSLYPMGNGDLSKSRSGIFRMNTGSKLPDTISELVAATMPGTSKCV